MYKARGTECGQALLQKSWVVYAKRLAGPVTLGDIRRHARSKRCLKVLESSVCGAIFFVQQVIWIFQVAVNNEVFIDSTIRFHSASEVTDVTCAQSVARWIQLNGIFWTTANLLMVTWIISWCLCCCMLELLLIFCKEDKVCSTCSMIQQTIVDSNRSSAAPIRSIEPKWSLCQKALMLATALGKVTQWPPRAWRWRFSLIVFSDLVDCRLTLALGEVFEENHQCH